MLQVLISFTPMLVAQDGIGIRPCAKSQKMVRLYEDNDFFNLGASLTDEGYSNGSRIDLFYAPERKSATRFNTLMPKASPQAVNTHSLGLMQMIVTPANIKTPAAADNDYQYAGALFAIYAFHSADPVKKQSIQTELVAGLRGPASLAEQSHSAIHRMLGYPLASGWKNQLQTKILANINMSAEKQLWGIGGSIESIGGIRISAGTMMNSAAAYSIIRTGSFGSYFDGLISQYVPGKQRPNRLRVCAQLRSEVELVAGNAMLACGKETLGSEKRKGEHNPAGHTNRLNHLVFKAEYSLMVSSSWCGISFSQKSVSSLMKGLKPHRIGNITISFLL